MSVRKVSAAIAVMIGVWPFGALGEGAIALRQGEDGSVAWGSSFNWGDRTKAEAIALQRCLERGENCELVAHISEQCFALAIQEKGSQYAWKTNRDENVAARQALAACEAHGRRCKLATSICDSPSAGIARVSAPSGVRFTLENG